MINRHSTAGVVRHRLRRWIVTLLAAFLMASGTAVAVAYHDLQSQLNLRTLKTSKLVETTPSDSFHGRALNIVVIGSDTRDGANGKIGASPGEGMRSDTTMIMHISADRKRVDVVSIPRDMLVDIPACERLDGTTTKSQHAQFNWAFSYGGLDGSVASGAACTVNTINQMSALQIDAFVVIDFSGFKQMIDALGGVHMCFDEDLTDKEAGLSIKKGCRLVGSNQALAYARARKNLADGSDLSRVGRQQELMGAMVQEALQKNYLTDMASLYAFAKSALQSVQTSENLGDLQTVAGLAASLQGFNPNSIIFAVLPVTTAPTDENRLIPTSKAEDVWQALMTDTPLPTGIGAKTADGQQLDGPTDSPSPSESATSSSQKLKKSSSSN